MGRGSSSYNISVRGRLPREAISSIAARAIKEATGVEADPLLRPTKDPSLGDFQLNAAFALGKKLREPPREVAKKIVGSLPRGVISKASVGGGGFINLWVSDQYLSEYLNQVREDALLGCGSSHPERVVVDYSAPNVAKQMHVGHLRSTVIGDAIARVLSLQGHEVIKQNHLGDWGTQFGMLLAHLQEREVEDFSQLGREYQIAKQRFDQEDGFQDEAREAVVRLQSGDEEMVKKWRAMVNLTERHMQDMYERLNVSLTPSDTKAESAYNDQLEDIVEELSSKGVAKRDDGAVVVFHDSSEAPLVIEKSGGGYMYPTTDLAAIRHRLKGMKAQRVIYVTDSRQREHFQGVFEAAEKAGWLTTERVSHANFGSVLGSDGKPFKTREGDVVPLQELLDEAEERSLKLVREKSPDLETEEALRRARVVGVGALKYADLAGARHHDYTFSFERMLALDGNTAPYLQYADVRARAILRKARSSPGKIQIHTQDERELALKLSEFPHAVKRVEESLEPHHLCSYLYELANSFSSFYEKTPVLKTPEERSRLGLVELVDRTLEQGLDVLGIQTLERM